MILVKFPKTSCEWSTLGLSENRLYHWLPPLLTVQYYLWHIHDEIVCWVR